MTLTFLFWNIAKKPLLSEVCQLVREHQADVILLAECSLHPDLMSSSLRAQTGHSYHNVSPGIDSALHRSSKVKVFSRLDKHRIQSIHDDASGRLTIKRLFTKTGTSVLLAGVHFPGKLHWNDDEQLLECVELARDICRVEREFRTENTILVGDLNMHPFDKGVAATTGLHAVMTRNIARRGRRSVAGRSYPFFYNPMWGLLGDRQLGPPGTIYYSSGGHVEYFWHMFDQVLIRPGLIDHFLHNDLAILDRSGDVPLISRGGTPDKNRFSDHLPILFRMDMQ